MLSAFTVLIFGSLFFTSCHKEPEKSTPLDVISSGVSEREACELIFNVGYSSTPSWQATVSILTNGSWNLLAIIGGVNNTNPGAVVIPNGGSAAFSISGYAQYRINQTNGNVVYTLLSPSGGITKHIYGNTSYTFYAGCEPVPKCDMTIRIGNACQSTWEALVKKRGANGNFTTLYHIGGLGSDAPIKLKTGGAPTPFSIEGFADTQFQQLSGNTNYIINSPTTGQFAFSLANGAICIPNTEGGTFQSTFGCTGQ